MCAFFKKYKYGIKCIINQFRYLVLQSCLTYYIQVVTDGLNKNLLCFITCQTCNSIVLQIISWRVHLLAFLICRILKTFNTDLYLMR